MQHRIHKKSSYIYCIDLSKAQLLCNASSFHIFWSIKDFTYKVFVFMCCHVRKSLQNIIHAKRKLYWGPVIKTNGFEILVYKKKSIGEKLHHTSYSQSYSYYDAHV